MENSGQLELHWSEARTWDRFMCSRSISERVERARDSWKMTMDRELGV